MGKVTIEKMSFQSTLKTAIDQHIIPYIALLKHIKHIIGLSNT